MKYTPRVHKTPRLLYADAYTIGADLFQAPKARQKSIYYATFRRALHAVNPDLYDKGDERLVLAGLQRILHRIFFEPVTHEEIDQTVEFLAHAKVNAKGEFKRYYFNEQMWRDVVDKYNGRIPIEILAMPEGSIIYPNEPFLQTTNIPEGFGELAAWFESKILHVYGASERLTQDRHWFEKLKKMIRMVDPNMEEDLVHFFASIMLTDFGDRAALNIMESEDLGMTHLYTYGGTDTFTGAFQAWMNSGKKPGIFSSVPALAHRNVQAFDKEYECFNYLESKCEDFDFMSMVGDCYDFRYAVEHYQIPIAKRVIEEGTGKIVVARPDSGNALEEVLWVCNTAVKHGLYTTIIINGEEWKAPTSLHFIEGDGMTHKAMWEIIMALIENKFVPWMWGLFGMGGGGRNALKRDNLSGKFALCAIGIDNQPVCKFSDTYGKTTLPGPFKILRSQEALENKRTIVFPHEEGENAMVVYYNGLDENFFDGGGMLDDFNVIKARIDQQFATMPLSLRTEENHGYPASDEMIYVRKELLKKYAPSKNVANY